MTLLWAIFLFLEFQVNAGTSDKVGQLLMWLHAWFIGSEKSAAFLLQYATTTTHLELV